MEQLRDIAERILFSPCLEDKLHPFPKWVDTKPGAPQSAKTPARDTQLRMQTTPGKHAFPARTALERERTQALHTFANHELLAVELMALALLRFPDAPPAFRRGIAITLQDEQRHVQLYLDRMAACGCEFGSQPMNGFFWKHIATMQSPLDYVARLSMTFEQANLDFSLYYRNAFKEIGDTQTAAILDTIYHDEIAHVRLGATWLQEWKHPGETDWDAYQRGLAPPLTPARAKGIGFNPAGRKAAGLSSAFIDSLRVYAHSKGRHPSVWLFNPACEEECIGHTPGKAARVLQHDLALLPGLLAAQDDILLVPAQPRVAFLNQLADFGIHLPQCVSETPKALSQPLRSAHPWGNSPHANRRLQAAGAPGAPPPLPNLHAKTFAHQLRPQIPTLWPDPLLNLNTVANSAADAKSATDQLHTAGQQVILKAPYGVAGRGNRYPTASKFPLNWVEHTIHQQNALLVEARLPIIAEFSVLFSVRAKRTKFIGFSRFGCDPRGQYQWSSVNRPLDGLAPSAIRFLNAGGDLVKQLTSLATQVGALLRQQGYLGPAGLDMILYQHDETFGLRAISEINPRFTMGHVALALRNRVPASKQAIFSLRPLDHERLPPILSERAGEPILSSGDLSLTDPETAQRICAVLHVPHESR